MGNTFATLALFAWPVVVVVLFNKLPVPKALAISIVGGYLLLPVEPSFDLPLLPRYDKQFAAALPALLMALAMTRQPLRGGPPAADFRPGWLPQTKLLRVCFIAVLVTAFMTVLTNGDTVTYVRRVIPGLRPYDAAASILSALTLLLPFLLARKYLARPQDQAMLLAVLAVAALAYSLPTLWEVRLSPRLNMQVYGFFPHNWQQHLRSGGFRPVVFLEHGLRLGLFLAIGVLSIAVTLRISPDRFRAPAIAGILWLLATLVLSKNLTAFLIVCLLLPVILVLRPRSQLLFAAILGGIVLVYPMMRASGLVPIETVTSAIGTFAEGDRVRSLNYRFRNEDILLEKANERPLFGWGGWGRARVYDEEGRDISVTDGAWIIEFGENGWIGYLARFGLLTLPVLLLAVRRKNDPVTLGTSGLAVVLVGNLLDLLPNSGLTPLTWLMAGSLAGRLEARTADNLETQAAPAVTGRPAATPYGRGMAGGVAETAPAGEGRPGALPYRRQFPTSAAARQETAPERRSPVTGVRQSSHRRPPRKTTS